MPCTGSTSGAVTCAASAVATRSRWVVAIDGDEPVGGIALVRSNMDSHRDLSPWLAGTLVHPTRRGEGIGSALVKHAVHRARELRVGRLYLYTERARGPLREGRLPPGRDEVYEGEPVTVTAVDLLPPSTLEG